jgi:hypothetical protein
MKRSAGRVGVVGLGAAAALVAGCAAGPEPMPAPDSPEAARAIVAAYERAVARALDDPEKTWHSGWTGNVAVRVLGGRHEGLCFHWQREVYQGVSQTAAAHGWQALGVHVNRGELDEHHAVVVFDPSRVAMADLLTEGGAMEALVLDPWPRGRAEVFVLGDWLGRARGPEDAGVEDLACEQLLWARRGELRGPADRAE